MKKLLFAILCIAIVSSCRKQHITHSLPPITDTGANTFALEVNGNIYTAGTIEKTITFPTSTDTVISFLIQNKIKNANNFVLNMTFYPTINHTHILANADNFGADVATFGFNSDSYVTTDTTHTGQINIIRFSGGVLSGTFEFNAINTTGNVMHIENGRFDITL